MNIPKIKRDITNTTITNKQEIMDFINSYDNIDELRIYLKLIEGQNKVDKSEVKPIIEVVKNRINSVTNKYNEYDNIKQDFDKLNEFYDNNTDFILSCMRNVNKNNLDSTNVRIVIDFLKFCLEKEQNGYQNSLKVQNLFNDYLNYYSNNKDKFSDNIRLVLDEIILKKEDILNSIDNTAMDYKEDDYLSRTQVLRLSPNKNNGHNLTEDDLLLNSKAFVATTIILEASLAIALIIALIIVFK